LSAVGLSFIAPRLYIAEGRPPAPFGPSATRLETLRSIAGPIIAAARWLAYPVAMGRLRAHRLTVPLWLIAAVALLMSACDGPPHVMSLALVNSTDARLYIRVDGEPYPDAELHWVEPGETFTVGDGRYLWEQPRRVQAFDERGALRFDRSFAEGDLDALNWRIVLQEDQRPPSP